MSVLSERGRDWYALALNAVQAYVRAERLTSLLYNDVAQQSHTIISLAQPTLAWLCNFVEKTVWLPSRLLNVPRVRGYKGAATSRSLGNRG